MEIQLTGTPYRITLPTEMRLAPRRGGYELARALSRDGATLVSVVRDEARGEPPAALCARLIRTQEKLLRSLQATLGAQGETLDVSRAALVLPGNPPGRMTCLCLTHRWTSAWVVEAIGYLIGADAVYSLSVTREGSAAADSALEALLGDLSKLVTGR